MFHVFAAYPVLMSMIASGGHLVLPTPAGYRGEGVFDNLWKLIDRWKATYLVTVPTALSALMQRPINADISTLRGAFSGSAPLPVELFNRFEKATGVQIVEGYGLTECTCLVSVNPPDGNKKIGSVGIPFPHTHVRILTTDGAGGLRDCATDEVGEICVYNPGVSPGATDRLIKACEDEDLPLLPVARAVWEPLPSLAESAEAWMLAGGSHHTVLTNSVSLETIEDFARIAKAELVIIDEDTNLRAFRKELQWSASYYRLAAQI